MNQRTHNLLAHVVSAQSLRQWATGRRSRVGQGQGVVRGSSEALEVDDALANRDPVLDMDALALLSRLVSAVPAPKQHLTRYSGVLAAAAHWRPLIIPAAPADTAAGAAPAPSPMSTEASPTFTKPQKLPPSGKRCCYIKWAELLRLTFGLAFDQCSACGGRMKLRGLARDPESIERFLRHRGIWAPPIDQSPARPPPYHRSVTRLAPTRQEELFPET